MQAIFKHTDILAYGIHNKLWRRVGHITGLYEDRKLFNRISEREVFNNCVRVCIVHVYKNIVANLYILHFDFFFIIRTFSIEVL